MEASLLAALASRTADWLLRGSVDARDAHAGTRPPPRITFAAVAGPGDDDDDDDDKPGGDGGNIDPDDDEGYDDDDDDDEEEPLQVRGPRFRIALVRDDSLHCTIPW